MRVSVAESPCTTLAGRYYVRVSAENTVPFQDNNRVYGFSTPRFAITADMPPLAPTSVTLYEYTGSSVLVRVGVPLGSGGQVCVMCARTRSRSTAAPKPLGWLGGWDLW